MKEEQLKAKSNAILDKLEEGGFDLGDWSIEDAHNNGFISGYHECQKEHEWHCVKDGDLPPNYKIVFDQNNNKVYYVSELKLWMYEGSSNVAEVEKWKEIE